MSDPTANVIEDPVNNPAGHRAYQALSLVEQAQSAWEGLTWGLSAGYNSAWKKQQKLLNTIQNDIETDENRQIFLLSIFCAGFGGALFGGVVGGALGTNTLAAYLSAAADDAASQFGGTFLDYFRRRASGTAFNSPGVEPLTFLTKMQQNNATFFKLLKETIGQIIQDIKSNVLPASAGERCYQYILNHKYIDNIPSAQAIGRDYEREASLCLWIAWGVERDFTYWNEAWRYMLRGVQIGPSGTLGFSSREWDKTYSYYLDLQRWLPIINEIRDIDPTLTLFITMGAPGMYSGGFPKREMFAGLYVDVRKLMGLGLFSKIESAQAMSRYFSLPNMAIDPKSARDVLANSFGGIPKYLVPSK